MTPTAYSDLPDLSARPGGRRGAVALRRQPGRRDAAGELSPAGRAVGGRSGAGGRRTAGRRPGAGAVPHRTHARFPMTATLSPDPGPYPKATMPPLDARAPRPPAVQLRRGIVMAVTMGGASLVAGALAWAFVLQPGLRAQTHAARQDASIPTSGEGSAEQSGVTGGPSTYAQLNQLPPPRLLGKPPADTAPAPVRLPLHAGPAVRRQDLGGGRPRLQPFLRGRRAQPHRTGRGTCGHARCGEARRLCGGRYNTHELLAAQPLRGEGRGRRAGDPAHRHRHLAAWPGGCGRLGERLRFHHRA